MDRVIGLVFSGFAVKVAAIVLALIVATEAADFVVGAFAPVDAAIAAKF